VYPIYFRDELSRSSLGDLDPFSSDGGYLEVIVIADPLIDRR